jgi:hypothetical protein
MVSVKLNGIHHIDHLQYDSEAFAWSGWPILPDAPGRVLLLLLSN